MIYKLLHPIAHFIFLPFVLKLLRVKGLENLPKKGPVLLACTHPNSFFDAIIICGLLSRPVWSLARGDVFKKKWADTLLRQTNILPIYRLSEGKENLGKNDETFDAVQYLLGKDQVVLIFSEGLCVNQQELLPLKKGTGRLVQMAWEGGSEVQIVPIGLSYNHFGSFNKLVNMSIGQPIKKADFDGVPTGGSFLRKFNDTLKERLESLLSWQFDTPSFFKNPLYYIGWVINFPVYLLASAISKKLTKGTVHFDSVTFGIVFFLMPIYWLILASTLWITLH